MWEERYAGSQPIWSGRPNARLVEVISDLTPGTALDLGCGEGGDAVWLAQRGWRVTAVDISNNALQRAAHAAAGLAPAIDFQRHDLTATFPDGLFDLVSAQYLHSPFPWSREALMLRASAAVARGGILLIVDHGEPPPWAEHGHDHKFASVDEVLAGLSLDLGSWETLRAEASGREGVSPDGHAGALVDNVIVLRRKD